MPLTEVTAVFTVTLWMRLVGATAAGWMADRMGRKAPLMISILWYSICNFIAGFSPSFTFLFFGPRPAGHRHGRGMAGRRGAGHGILAGTLARLHVRRAARLMGAGLRVVRARLRLPVSPLELASGCRWRGMLILGVLPALVCRVDPRLREGAGGLGREQAASRQDVKQQVSLPLFAIFKRKYLFNTLDRLPVDGRDFCVYYAIWALLGTYLQKELSWTPPRWRSRCSGATSSSSLASASGARCRTSVGRRWAMMIPAFIAIFITPLYLATTDPHLFLDLVHAAGRLRRRRSTARIPSYLSERFPTEVRATAAGFVYHQGAIWGGLVAPVLTYFAVDRGRWASPCR